MTRLEDQVRILGADNEELTAQLNKDQFYDASGEDDDVTKVIAQEVKTQGSVLEEPLQHLAEHANKVKEGEKLVVYCFRRRCTIRSGAM